MLLVLTVQYYIELKCTEFKNVMDISHITNKENCMRTVEKCFVCIHIQGDTKIATQINDESTNSANAIFGAVVAQSMT